MNRSRVYRKMRSLKGKGVGVHISKSEVTAVEIQGKKGASYFLAGFAYEPLPPEGERALPVYERSAKLAFRRLKKKVGLKGRPFAASLSGSSVFMMKVEIPAMPPFEVAELVPAIAKENSPFAVDEARLDFVMPEELPQPESDSTIEILLIAVRRAPASEISTLVRRSGKASTRVDLDSLALKACYEANYDLDSSDVVGLVNVGADTTSITILDQGESAYIQDLPHRGSDFGNNLKRVLGILRQKAEMVEPGIKQTPGPGNDVGKVLAETSDTLASQIGDAFHTFGRGAGGQAVERIFVSGEGALTPTLLETLETRLGIGVEILNPFRRIRYGGHRLSAAWLTKEAPKLAVPVGLALRELEFTNERVRHRFHRWQTFQEGTNERAISVLTALLADEAAKAAEDEKLLKVERHALPYEESKGESVRVVRRGVKIKGEDALERRVIPRPTYERVDLVATLLGRNGALLFGPFENWIDGECTLYVGHYGPYTLQLFHDHTAQQCDLSFYLGPTYPTGDPMGRLGVGSSEKRAGELRNVRDRTYALERRRLTHAMDSTSDAIAFRAELEGEYFVGPIIYAKRPDSHSYAAHLNGNTVLLTHDYASGTIELDAVECVGAEDRDVAPLLGPIEEAGLITKLGL